MRSAGSCDPRAVCSSSPLRDRALLVINSSLACFVDWSATNDARVSSGSQLSCAGLASVSLVVSTFRSRQCGPPCRKEGLSGCVSGAMRHCNFHAGGWRVMGNITRPSPMICDTQIPCAAINIDGDTIDALRGVIRPIWISRSQRNEEANAVASAEMM